jgi:hypothetical protein
MEFPMEMEREDSRRMEIRTSYFTRRLVRKLKERGTQIPASVALFLDTPIRSFDESQKAYFEEKFRPMMPTIVSILTEVYEEVEADKDGWGDMITYGNSETPIKICAREVLERKTNKASDSDVSVDRLEQRSIGMQFSPQVQ